MAQNGKPSAPTRPRLISDLAGHPPSLRPILRGCYWYPGQCIPVDNPSPDQFPLQNWSTLSIASKRAAASDGIPCRAELTRPAVVLSDQGHAGSCPRYSELR
jgi:hypothetical protein